MASLFEYSEPAAITVNQQDHQRRLGELMREVQRIAKPGHRQAVCAVARALAEHSDKQLVELA